MNVLTETKLGENVDGKYIQLKQIKKKKEKKRLNQKIK